MVESKSGDNHYNNQHHHHHHYRILLLYFSPVPPDQVKITRDPKEFRSGETGRIICESGSSNPPAEMSWWKQGIPVPESRNSTKPGLHGGFVSSVEITLEFKEKMNGEVYTCQARNAALERAIHDATTLVILCKYN